MVMVWIFKLPRGKWPVLNPVEVSQAGFHLRYIFSKRTPVEAKKNNLFNFKV